MIEAPISVGELFDKITILQIKVEHGIKEAQKELQVLQDKIPPNLPGPVDAAVEILRSINQACWDTEESKRLHEREKRFDDEFIHLARSVYMFNDERARVKKIINQFSGSEIVEYKSYEEY